MQSKKLEKPTDSIIGISVIGFILGGYIVYLVMLFWEFQTIYRIIRAPISTIINQIMVPLAERSLNLILIGALIGALAGFCSVVVIRRTLKLRRATITK